MDQSLNINTNTQTLSANFPLKSPLKLYGFFFLRTCYPSTPGPKLQMFIYWTINLKFPDFSLLYLYNVIRPRELYCDVTLGPHSSTKAWINTRLWVTVCVIWQQLNRVNLYPTVKYEMFADGSKLWACSSYQFIACFMGLCSDEFMKRTNIFLKIHT